MNYEKQNRMLAIFKVLSNSNRIKILHLINDSKLGFLSVNDIFSKLDVAQPTVSDHLKLMRLHKIVRAKQDGSNMFYSIKDSFVQELINRMN